MSCATFEAFLPRFFATICHIFLQEEYVFLGVRTQSVSKLLLSIQTGGIGFPKFLLDVAREVARPVCHDSEIFLPVLDLNFDGDSLVPGTGLSPIFSTDMAWNFLSEEHRRPVVAERLVPSPLIAFIDDGVSADVEMISTWRYNSVMLLRPLNNGAASPLPNEVVVRTARNSPSLSLERELNDQTPWTVKERFAPEPQTDLSTATVSQANQVYAQIAQGQVAVDHPRLNKRVLIFAFRPNRNELSAWVRQAANGFSHVRGFPQIVALESLHLFGVEFDERFPTRTHHSKTPPSKGPKQRTFNSRPKMLPPAVEKGNSKPMKRRHVEEDSTET